MSAPAPTFLLAAEGKKVTFHYADGYADGRDSLSGTLVVEHTQDGTGHPWTRFLIKKGVNAWQITGVHGWLEVHD